MGAAIEVHTSRMAAWFFKSVSKKFGLDSE